MSQNNLQLKQIKDQLAIQNIKEEYGIQSSQIMTGILKSQPYASLDKIIQTIQQNQNIKAENIQEFLLLFLKNGLIYTEQHKYKEEYTDDQATTLYFPNYTSIYAFQRHIKYINHVKSIFGQLAGLILEYYANNSSGNIDECIQTIMEENKNIKNEQDLRKIFIQLVYNQYLTRDVVTNKQSEEKENEFQVQDNKNVKNKEEKSQVKQTKTSKKTKGKKNLEEEPENSKKQKLEQDSQIHFKEQLEKQFFSQILQQSQQNQNNNNSQQNLAPFLNAEMFKNMGVQEMANVFSQQFGQMQQQQQKDQQQQQDISADFLLKDSVKNILYNFQINHRRFIHDFRTKEICEIIEGKIGITEKFIIQTMLDKSQNLGKAKQFKKTEAKRLDEIMSILPQELKRKKEHEIKESLEALNSDATQFIAIEYEGSQKLFRVNVKKIVGSMKFRHMAKIIERKYDVETARIFRIMKQYLCLDENAVADLSLLSLEQVRSCLQTLVKDNFLVYDNAKEKDKQNLIYSAYSYNKEDVLQKIQEVYYQSIYNLKIKLEKAYKDSKEIEESLEKQERTKEWQQILKLIKTLEIAILELDSALLCFTEY